MSERGLPGPRAGSRGLRGLDHLGDDLYRRWVRVAVMVALVAYGVVMAVDILVFGLGARPAALISQGITVVALGIALGLSRWGWSGAAAVLTLITIWLELQSTIPFYGMAISGLIAFPVFVSAAGILLGGRAAYLIGAGTTVSLALVAVLGQMVHPESMTPSGQTVYLLVVTAASMFAAAALVQLGLDSLARVLLTAHASEQRLTDLLRDAPDGILAADAEGRVVSANPAAERLLGIDAGSLLGSDLLTTLTGALAEPISGGDSRRLTGMLDPHVRDRAVPLRLQGEEGAPHFVDAQVSSVSWADGSTGRQIMLRDVTEQRRAEENERVLRTRLEHAQRLEAVGRLAGGVAHEFNNLLTIVGPAAEMLLAETEGASRALATEILEAKVRGAALTKQLLAFARKDLIQPRRVSLTEVAGEMRMLLERFLTAQTRFVLDAEHATPPVVADRAQLEQILVTLVINAKDAIAGEGRVTLGIFPEGTERSWNGRTWTVEPGFVEMSVEDDGEGMDDTVLNRAFEPFFSTKPRGRGTGLGLATVHGTVVQNGGRVRILSERGVGTVAVVEWPVASRA